MFRVLESSLSFNVQSFLHFLRSALLHRTLWKASQKFLSGPHFATNRDRPLNSKERAGNQYQTSGFSPETNQQRRSQSARKLRLPSLRLKLCCSPRSFARFAYTFFSKPKACSCRCHVSSHVTISRQLLRRPLSPHRDSCDILSALFRLSSWS